MRSHGDFPTFLFYERVCVDGVCVCVDTPYSVATSNPTHRAHAKIHIAGQNSHPLNPSPNPSPPQGSISLILRTNGGLNSPPWCILDAAGPDSSTGNRGMQLR